MTKTQTRKTLDSYRLTQGVGPVTDPHVFELFQPWLQLHVPRLAGRPLHVVWKPGDAARGRRGSLCYAAELPDGRLQPFSTSAILRPPTEVEVRTKRMREAIAGQMAGFKASAFRDAEPELPLSALSGQPLTWDDAEVDHLVPFHRLRDTWLTSAEDPDDMDSWAIWHLTHARVRLLSRAENSARGGAEGDEGFPPGMQRLFA
ncbi:hypothetical protein EDD41_2733 [Luteococcus japonicus]|uniref:Uncharacterized protein n=1 Tax=Luteococcus japonicus TaxID=33984 RepID=A0A3N1ZX79_9ACTN|nr:hypothetical protein [Luteococcus japonicus]ROR55459.1 hypothetical protein EDD41_2733 [Luteococcus japonicus]